MEQFMSRLTEVERVKIRSASPGALEYLRQTKFLVDNVSYKLLLNVQTALNAVYESYDSTLTMVPSTWTF